MRTSPPSARVERERTEQRPQLVCVPRLGYHAAASAAAWAASAGTHATFEELTQEKPHTSAGVAGEAAAVAADGVHVHKGVVMRTEKVPKPIRVTWSPFFSAPVIELVMASSARPAAALEMSADSAIASISSDLFTLNPFDFRLKML